MRKKILGQKVRKIIAIIGAIIVVLLFTIGCVSSTPSSSNNNTFSTEDYTIDSTYSLWDNATVYFVMTDRFYNGNTGNDHSYGREDDTSHDSIGAFHGGDLAGLTAKINSGYFDDLSIDAIWITAPYEQIHGWVVGYVGGNPAFRHYAYHGYYALDYTKVDANMGTLSELQTFVDTAHSKGIRIIFDVVMNHPGYGSIIDLHEQGFDGTILQSGWASATVTKYHDYIDYNNAAWANWWGIKWIRAGLGGGYDSAGSDDLTESVNSLPDFKTESTETGIGLPPFLAAKSDTSADVNEYYESSTVRGYLVKWLTDWVENYGIDGFRCDTAKHVEKASWLALKTAANAALKTWRSANPSKAFPDSDYLDTNSPFWMTGEVWGHGVTKDDYYTSGGFDSLINFNFVNAVNSAINGTISDIDSTYLSYAKAINTDHTFNVLSYLSSHDTYLFYDQYAGKSADKQKEAGTLLLLCPGAVQIFYGDETGRPVSSVTTDSDQKVRSDMNWSSIDTDIQTHWQKLTKFRKKHIAIGSGKHQGLTKTPYVFSRVRDTDKVICVIGASGSTTIEVSSVFSDGDTLTDYYTGNTATVTGGKVTFTADSNGVILIEKN